MGRKNWEEELEESRIAVQQELLTFQMEMEQKNDIKIEGLKQIYDDSAKRLKKEVDRQQELLDQQTKQIYIQENILKFKDFGLNILMNKIQFPHDGFVSDPQEIKFENGIDASSYPNQTHNYSK